VEEYPRDNVRQSDDAWIAWFLHEANRSQTVLVCFLQTHFCFFRPLSSELVPASQEEPTKSLWKQAVRSGKKAYKKEWAKQEGWVGGVPPVFKLMRVKLIKRVARSELYTAVDSLSGDRNVIQRTCPPLWRVKGTHLSVKTLGVGKQTTHRAGHLKNEEGFGTFLRLYFNGLLRDVPGFEDGSTLAHPLGPNAETLSSPDWRELASKTFNPILLETAAYYFCLDVGGHDNASGHARLLPDVGVGKGLSIIDVRARVRPDTERNRKAVAEAFRARLARIRGKELDEDHPAVERLKDSGVLELQCKAARAKLDPENKALVFFGHGGDAGTYTERAEVLFDKLLQALHQNPSAWPHMNAFMDMQAENLRRSAGVVE
jgi:hypothetical protein